MSDNETWLTVEQAAAILGVSERQTYRYGKGSNPKIQTRSEGRRTMFYAPDVMTLAQELNAPPPPPRTELMEAGQFLDYISDLHRRLEEAAAREGYLRAQLDQQRLSITDQRDLYQRLTQAEAERDALQARITELERQNKKPWWKLW